MYQFIHIDLYAEIISKKAITRRSQNKQGNKSLFTVNEILAEAQRSPDSCPHVIAPQYPVHIYGESLKAVEKLAYDSKKNKQDKVGRKLRKDTPILLAGVCSYPNEMYEADRPKFNNWLEATQSWLEGEFGDNLQNITLHLDEAHPHIHFYAISKTGNAKDIHPGYCAEKKKNNKPKTRMTLHKSAMRAFQDRYYLEVSARFGLQRIGPKKQRLSRPEKQAKDAEAKQVEILLNQVDQTEQYFSETNKQRELELAQKELTIIQEANKKAEEIVIEAKRQAWAWFNKVRHPVKYKLAEMKNQNRELQNEKLSYKKKLETAELKNEQLINELNAMKAQKLNRKL